MSDNEMLYCLIAFILGWLASRMMGNGFSVGGDQNADIFVETEVNNAGKWGGYCRNVFDDELLELLKEFNINTNLNNINSEQPPCNETASLGGGILECRCPNGSSSEKCKPDERRCLQMDVNKKYKNYGDIGSLGKFPDGEVSCPLYGECNVIENQNSL